MDAVTPSQQVSAQSHAAPYAAQSVTSVSLGNLFEQLRSGSDEVREAAWEAIYQHYWQLVWTRVFYVIRTISWLDEPREMASDITSDVFVGLPEAVKHYREAGKPEQWLKLIAVRTALRRREALTGQWSNRRPNDESTARDSTVRGRSFVSYEESAEQIVSRLDGVEPEELLELNRRREALRNSPDETKRRWDEFLQLYIDGFDFKEIGDRMALTEATARNWLCKIRKYLAQPVAVGERDD